MELLGFVIFLLVLIVTPLYIMYRVSDYSKISKHSFFTVHLSIFIDERSWLLRRIFRRYLGLYHEYRIYSALEGVSGEKKILANLYIPQGETVTDTEIDILFIHESGVYSIEAKDMKGYITGYRNSHMWLQKFGRRISYEFPNPIIQNYGHIKSLSKLISCPINSLIVFSWRGRLGISDLEVIKKYELKKYFIGKNEKILTSEEINGIYKLLEPYSHSTKEQETLHIREIHDRYERI